MPIVVAGPVPSGRVGSSVYFPAAFFGIAYQVGTVIHTAVTTDRYGDSTRTTQESDLPQCLFKPAQSTESTVNAPGVSTDATIYCPQPDLPIDADDKIRLGGQLWEIIGIPLEWGQAGLEIPVRRWGNG